MSTFGLMGNGKIAGYHKKAIEHVAGEISWIYDPMVYTSKSGFDRPFKEVDYIVICSPSHLHREQIQTILRHDWCFNIICEKPYVMPWEPHIDDDRINIVLQYRYIPKSIMESWKPRSVEVRFLRDSAYFKSWKGNPKLTGGLFYNLFIHYIDLAQQLGVEFTGMVAHNDANRWYSPARRVLFKGPGFFDLFKLDMQSLYDTMYHQIMIGNGIKPKDVFFLHWLMDHAAQANGFMGISGLEKEVKISPILK